MSSGDFSRAVSARRTVLAVATLAMALAVGACGDEEGGETGGEGGGGGQKLTIYSSLPLQGAARAQAVATVNGAKLALKEAGGKAGDFTIEYVSLDDSTAQAGGWEPGQTAANARKAIGDDSTIAYIGEFNSGATAVSLPLLNEAGIAQVSPGNTAVGITSDDPGATPGEPDKYYPTGERTYARILPKDTYQGAALATLAKDEGCESVYILNDKEVYGAGLASNVELAAKDIGLEIKGNDGVDKNAANYRALGAKIKGTGAECFIYCGITANNAVQIFKDMAVALPDGALLGPGGRRRDRVLRPRGGRAAGGRREPRADHDPGRGARGVPAGRPRVPEGVRGRVRREEPRPLRGLRLRVDEPDPRRDRARRRERRRPRGGGRPAVRHEGPRGRVRHLLDRRERRHHAHPVRRLQDQGRPAGLRPQREAADLTGGQGVVARQPNRNVRGRPAAVPGWVCSGSDCCRETARR